MISLLKGKVQLYDTNLSWCLQFDARLDTAHWLCVVIQWWYDAGMRKRWWMPIELYVYNTRR